ncbi:hypothetical protein [Halorussus sp. AFM4]|uniref:hypothetical protein n=1 Tax=Halorussus sp. AFM4 TaxID=3421651 RepID=UPI003EBE2E53
MERNVTLEAEEWYVLVNWLRERENRLQYALRSKSREWAFVRELRREIERRQRGETASRRDGDGARRPEPEDGREPGRRDGSGGAPAGPGETDGSGAALESETGGRPLTVTLSDRQVAYLDSFLRKRARRLLLRPWRDRERRDVRHLRDHLLAAAGRGDRSGTGVQRKE